MTTLKVKESSYWNTTWNTSNQLPGRLGRHPAFPFSTSTASNKIVYLIITRDPQSVFFTVATWQYNYIDEKIREVYLMIRAPKVVIHSRAPRVVKWVQINICSFVLSPRLVCVFHLIPFFKLTKHNFGIYDIVIRSSI